MTDTHTHAAERLDAAIAPHLPAFFGSAAEIVNAGMAYARADDPNRLATLQREFDHGRGVPCLVVEGFGTPEQRVCIRMVGAVDGAERIVELFSFSVHGPDADGGGQG